MKNLIKVLSAGVLGGIVGAIVLECLLERNAIDGDGLIAHLIAFFSPDDLDDLWEDEVYENDGADEREYINLDQETST